MANRTANYIAFDGLGQTNPALSDFRYYSTIQGWSASAASNFTYVNAHEKTAAVRDTSKRATLEARIRQRLAASKNMVVILSKDTRKLGSMLSYEIEQAVDRYGLPLICAYTGYERVMAPRALSARWPHTLTQRINDDTARAIHIPFKKNALLDAIGQFTVHKSSLTNGLHYYDGPSHDSFGLYAR